MIWFVMLGLYFGCSGSGNTPQNSSAYTVDYDEDLSVYRTSYDYKANEENTVTPSKKPATGTRPEQTLNIDTDITVTRELDNLLASVAEKNKNVKTIRGYTIQVYSGSNRERAEQVKRQVYHILPDSRPEIKFIPPNYRVQVGQFTEPLEAQKEFSQLKKEFPNAIISPDKIQINN